jgi:hypothetical protein
MYSVRRWSVRNARLLERFYDAFERIMVSLDPVWQKIGHDRCDKPVAAVERVVKGFLFDCKMCGRCILSSTGMSCPMNCPKSLRNGPCGGVRANGNCEVKPDMPCVWVEAWRGNQLMQKEDNIMRVQIPVNYAKQGTSAWLREVRFQKERQKISIDVQQN